MLVHVRSYDAMLTEFHRTARPEPPARGKTAIVGAIVQRNVTRIAVSFLATMLMGAAKVARDIAGAIEALQPTQDTARVRMTVSCGVASGDLSVVSPSDLLARADRRLYRAKRQGRGVVVAE